MAEVSKITLPDGTSYDIESIRTAAIPFGQVDSTSTSTVFTATVPGITELYDGVCVYLKNGVVTSASGFTININGLGALPVYSTLAAASRSTTIFNINYTMLFVYNSSRVSGGCWDCFYGYDSNTNTIAYQVRTNSLSLPMTAKVYRYRLLFTSADREHFVPANTSSSTNATASRDVIQTPIDPFGRIVYYGTTTAVDAGANPGASYLWSQYNITLGYSFNRTGAALTLTSWKPVYLKCAPQSDGSAIIDATTPYVQALPSTEDGKIYIFLGIASAATTVEVTLEHPIYYYKGGKIRLWTNAQEPPTKTSDLTNDSGFITGITSSDVTTALGYTPYNGTTNPNGYISASTPTNSDKNKVLAVAEVETSQTTVIQEQTLTLALTPNQDNAYAVITLPSGFNIDNFRIVVNGDSTELSYNSDEGFWHSSNPNMLPVIAYDSDLSQYCLYLNPNEYPSGTVVTVSGNIPVYGYEPQWKKAGLPDIGDDDEGKVLIATKTKIGQTTIVEEQTLTNLGYPDDSPYVELPVSNSLPMSLTVVIDGIETELVSGDGEYWDTVNAEETGIWIPYIHYDVSEGVYNLYAQAEYAEEQSLTVSAYVPVYSYDSKWDDRGYTYKNVPGEIYSGTIETYDYGDGCASSQVVIVNFLPNGGEISVLFDGVAYNNIEPFSHSSSGDIYGEVDPNTLDPVFNELPFVLNFFRDESSGSLFGALQTQEAGEYDITITGTKKRIVFKDEFSEAIAEYDQYVYFSYYGEYGYGIPLTSDGATGTITGDKLTEFQNLDLSKVLVLETCNSANTSMVPQTLMFCGRVMDGTSVGRNTYIFSNSMSTVKINIETGAYTISYTPNIPTQYNSSSNPNGYLTMSDLPIYNGTVV